MFRLILSQTRRPIDLSAFTSAFYTKVSVQLTLRGKNVNTLIFTIVNIVCFYFHAIKIKLTFFSNGNKIKNHNTILIPTESKNINIGRTWIGDSNLLQCKFKQYLGKTTSVDSFGQ